MKVKVAGGIEIAVEAYLVEARSWGGHSGSPGFVYFPPDRNAGLLMVGGTDPRLLGLVQGHYEFAGRLIGDMSGDGAVRLNASIVVVIPAVKILDLLNLPQFAEERDGISAHCHDDAPE